MTKKNLPPSPDPALVVELHEAIAEEETRRLTFREVRKLTLDVQSIGRLGAATIKCESDLYTIQMPDLNNPGYKRAMSVVDCWDADRDERYTLICNAVMESTFQRYTEGVNGRYFHLESGEMGNGKRYRKVEIIELEVVD